VGQDLVRGRQGMGLRKMEDGEGGVREGHGKEREESWERNDEEAMMHRGRVNKQPWDGMGR